MGVLDYITVFQGESLGQATTGQSGIDQDNYGSAWENTPVGAVSDFYVDELGERTDWTVDIEDGTAAADSDAADAGTTRTRDSRTSPTGRNNPFEWTVEGGDVVGPPRNAVTEEGRADIGHLIDPHTGDLDINPRGETTVDPTETTHISTPDDPERGAVEVEGNPPPSRYMADIRYLQQVIREDNVVPDNTPPAPQPTPDDGGSSQATGAGMTFATVAATGIGAVGLYFAVTRLLL